MFTTWKLSYECNGVSWVSGPTFPVTMRRFETKCYIFTSFQDLGQL